MDIQHNANAEETPTGPSAVETLRQVLDQPIDVKLSLLRHYAEMARLLATEIMDEEVETLTGKRYCRKGPGQRHRRWGTNPGSIRIDGERVPTAGIPAHVPRVRDVEAGEERPLESYQAMKRPGAPEGLAEAILLGLSQGDYQRVASQFNDGFGLSQSSVSRRFQQRAEQALQEFEGRPLKDDNFLALWTSGGKHIAGEQMIISVGVTEKGRKKVLGFTQATTERAEPIKEMLRELIERGLSFEEGLLCIVDGGRGVRKAIDDVFGRWARVQRCQWHKRENVVSYLPKADQKTWRSKLRRAFSAEISAREPSYEAATYEAAKARLMELKAELEPINRRAARSLMEGLEETLTLHRLGLFKELGRSLKTTNCIENLNGQVERYLGKVKRWHHSPQRHRWMALALLEAEQRMRRLTGYRHLPKLKQALKEALPDRE